MNGDIGPLRNPNAFRLTPRSGTNFLDLAGFTDGGFAKGISQQLTGLAVGQRYTFSMWLGLPKGGCPEAAVCAGPVQARATIGDFTHHGPPRRRALRIRVSVG